MRGPWRRNLTIAVLAVSLLGISAHLLRPRPLLVDLGKVTRGAMRVTVEGEGKTRVKDVYTVFSPVRGRMDRVLLEAGDPVKAGETLLTTIEPPEPDFLTVRSNTEAEGKLLAAEAALELAKAEVDRARAELAFAQAELTRTESLKTQGLSSAQAFEKAQLEVQTRKAALAVAEATGRSKAFERDATKAALIAPGGVKVGANSGVAGTVRLLAPVTGRILRVHRESEGIVNPDQELFDIGDPGNLELVVELLSEDAVKVRSGATAILEGWGGKTLNGRVTRVEPFGYTKISALGIEEQRVNVILDFADAREQWVALGHGYRVDAKIVIWEKGDALKVPMGALFRVGDAWNVYAMAGEVVQLRRVCVDHTTSVEAELCGGLDENTEVVLHPSDQLKEGSPVMRRPS